jgi:hypothetical protein
VKDPCRQRPYLLPIAAHKDIYQYYYATDIYQYHYDFQRSSPGALFIDAPAMVAYLQARYLQRFHAHCRLSVGARSIFFPILLRDLIDEKGLQLIIARLQVVAVHDCLKSKLMWKSVWNLFALAVRTEDADQELDGKLKICRGC